MLILTLTFASQGDTRQVNCNWGKSSQGMSSQAKALQVKSIQATCGGGHAKSRRGTFEIIIPSCRRRRRRCHHQHHLKLALPLLLPLLIPIWRQ